MLQITPNWKVEMGTRKIIEKISVSLSWVNGRVHAQTLIEWGFRKTVKTLYLCVFGRWTCSTAWPAIAEFFIQNNKTNPINECREEGKSERNNLFLINNWKIKQKIRRKTKKTSSMRKVFLALAFVAMIVSSTMLPEVRLKATSSFVQV